MKLAWFLFMAAAALAQVKVPRPAPELEIAEPSGRTAKLSSYRGDVVLLAFVVTSCPHCQAASKEFEKLQMEFGQRGFHAAEVAFDENPDVAAYTSRFGLTFPVGRGTDAGMRAFLGIAPHDRLATPQVVLIDRIGMIRAQSERLGSPMLQSGDVLRGLIAAMLGRHSIL
ncbi:MAG TPA: TlpA disulfide reductase family protein [Bryobacteraceae bacterium]|jgi:peroxiredoxin